MMGSSDPSYFKDQTREKNYSVRGEIIQKSETTVLLFLVSIFKQPLLKEKQKQHSFTSIEQEPILSSVQFSCLVVSDSLRPHGLQHARPPCPSPTPRAYPNSCPLSQCHPTISSSVIPFSSCPQSFPALGSFPMSQLFTSGGQSIGVSASASVLPMNTQH